MPAGVVARWAPGESLVEYVTATKSRITLGAWSWAGTAGLLATFGTDISEVEPANLRQACRDIAQRFLRQTAAAVASGGDE